MKMKAVAMEIKKTTLVAMMKKNILNRKLSRMGVIVNLKTPLGCLFIINKEKFPLAPRLVWLSPTPSLNTLLSSKVLFVGKFCSQKSGPATWFMFIFCSVFHVPLTKTKTYLHRILWMNFSEYQLFWRSNATNQSQRCATMYLTWWEWNLLHVRITNNQQFWETAVLEYLMTDDQVSSDWY